MAIRIKLQQGQVWRQGAEFIRIVRLERLKVEYKSTTALAAQKGIHRRTSKKDFCRLIKQADLLAAAKTSGASNEADAAGVVR